MSPWPGAPKSQQSPPLNPPSARTPPQLNEQSTPADIARAVNKAFDGLTVHEQAFANLPAQIATQAQAAVTELITQETTAVAGVTAFNAQTGAVIYFPNLGMVNDQLGNAAYLTQTADAGRKILMGDSTVSTVTLNPSVSLPWFTIIGNDSGSTVSLLPGSGAGFYGMNSIYPGGFALVFYDGTTFWSEGVAIATDSTYGVVRPDGGTIVIDSSSGALRTGGVSVTVITAKLTGGGTNGSMTYSDGVLISQVQAT